MKRVHWSMWSVALVAAGALGAPALSAQTPTPAPATAAAAAPIAADSVGLFEIAALHARETAQRLEAQGARSARPDPGTPSYVKGFAWLLKDQVDSAVIALRAAVAASPNMARYHGDLAFALAAANQWSAAEDEYRAAVRLQQANAWYFVGLGATQMAQEHWTQAAASFTLAVSADSAVIVQQLIGPASDAFQRSGMAQPLEDWARMATSRFPNEPTPWLRLASASYLKRDTAVGFPAIRRYRSLRPEDHVGAMLYAEYLLAAGQYDSAAILAHQAAPDTSLRHLAGIVMYNAGGHLLQASQWARAAEVLQEGREMAAPTERPQYDLYLGIAKFRVLQTFYNDAVSRSDCHRAHAADSMLTEVNTLITSGATADSALATQVLTGAMPQYRTAVTGFVNQCKGR